MNPLQSLDASWQAYFSSQLSQPYMQTLLEYVEEEYVDETVYPPKGNVWDAFKLTALSNVRVVIMGQDPYHGAGQAHGLSFSVQDNIKIPPSLKNIFKELNRDLGLTVSDSGNLQAWAEQGVLLLNSCLTVRESEPASHSKQGWEVFTQGCIDYINQHKEQVVFLAWGRFAHDVCAKIDTQKHYVIKTSHPSPLGATKQGKHFDAFLGSSCFSKANAYLDKHHKKPIDWNLAEHQTHNLSLDF
ncbi:uracil-DNA glycosylase [Pseudomonas sp. HK3]